MPDGTAEIFSRLRAVEVRRPRLAADLRDRLGKKLRRGARTFAGLRGWDTMLPDDPAELVQLVEGTPELTIALEPDALMRLHFAEHYGLTSRAILWDAMDGGPLLCWRSASSLVFLNDQKAHAWSRLRSLTGDETEKHLPTSTNRRASKFAVGVKIHAVERAVIAHGRGFAKTNTQLMMFGRFANNVGIAVDGGARTPTSIVQVHLDLRGRPRCRRTTTTGTVVWRACGTFVEVHGYPISEAQLRGGFPASAAQVLRQRVDNP